LETITHIQLGGFGRLRQTDDASSSHVSGLSLPGGSCPVAGGLTHPVLLPPQSSSKRPCTAGRPFTRDRASRPHCPEFQAMRSNATTVSTGCAERAWGCIRSSVSR
jgi:hypothetical protein